MLFSKAPAAWLRVQAVHLATIMPISYNASIGKAIKVWLNTSGGVKKAAMTKAASTTYLRIEISCSGVTTPSLQRTKLKIGISNTIPKERTNVNKKPMYWLMDSMGVAIPSPVMTKR